MKKLDDIMELLTDEINGFQNSIKKLEGLSKGLNGVKVDTSKLEYHLKEYLRHQGRVQSQNMKTLNDIDKKLKRARLIPKMAVGALSIRADYNEYCNWIFEFPNGPTEKKGGSYPNERKSGAPKSTVGCDLFRFYFTLISRNAIKSE